MYVFVPFAQSTTHSSLVEVNTGDGWAVLGIQIELEEIVWFF